MSKKKKLKITQFRSTIDQTYRQKLTIAALGLRRIRHSVVHDDTPQIRGMIAKVNHIVKAEEI
jgi:large subunit ribosomal protein L30